MIKDFLIISFIGKIDLLGLKLNNEFFIHKLVKDIKNNETMRADNAAHVPIVGEIDNIKVRNVVHMNELKRTTKTLEAGLFAANQDLSNLMNQQAQLEKVR